MKRVSLSSAQPFSSVFPRFARRALSASLAVFSVACLLLATERQAHAYINPGDGVMLQSLFAGLATMGYFLRSRIALFFGRGKKPVAGVVSATPATPDLRKDDTRSAA